MCLLKRGKMWLTKNEKKVLKLLLDNARLTDTFMAEKLKITSQAVRQIRKKLEDEKIIESYQVKISSEKLGVTAFAIIKFSINNDKDEVEKTIKENKNTILLIKTMDGSYKYSVTMGFPKLEDLNAFLNNNLINKKISVQEVLPFTQKNILKTSSKDLMHKMIDDLGK